MPRKGSASQPPQKAAVDPVFTEAVLREFPYAYPKAVLKASIERSHGTLEAREANKPYRLTMVFTMLNDHGQLLLDCSAILLGYQHEGRWHPVDRPLGTREAPFPVSPTQPRRLAFLTRDISDPITPEPFLLCLNGKRIPLADNSTYDLLIELRSKYPIPTVVTMRIVTREVLDAEAEITNMELAKFDPAVLAG